MQIFGRSLRSISFPHQTFNSIYKAYQDNKLFYIFGAILLIFGLVIITLIDNSAPVIELEHPTENIQVTTDQIYVKGRVKPKGSKITVNDAEVSLNGDGSFTYILPIKPGVNAIKVKAFKFSNKSEVVRLVERKEEQQQADKKELQKESVAEKKLGLFDPGNASGGPQPAISGAKVSDGTSEVVIVKQQLAPNVNPVKILGEVSNQTRLEVSDVKITAIFYNNDNEIADIKAAYAATPNLKLETGQSAPFEIQSSIQPSDFAIYKFEVAWQ